MTETLNAASFDIADMFTGISYPTEVVPFYTDQAIAYEFNKLSQDALDAINRKDEEAGREIEARRESLLKKAEANRFEIHLRGQSRDRRQAVRDAVDAEYPSEPDIFGRVKVNPKGDEVFVNRYWALHVERIVSPNGGMLAAPSEADIKALRGQSPDSELAKVEAAIQNLTEGAKSGFESLAQEHDFLSSASPEA